MKLSILFPEVSNIDRAIDRIVRLEQLGFHSAVMGTAFGFDPIATFALAGRCTERILLTTAIVPTYSRHPIAMAMAAATAQAASGGRCGLGRGPSHRPLVEHVYGVSYDKPVRHIREYITIVRELLQQGGTSFKGEMMRARAQVQVEGGANVPVLMSALGEQMCRTAGRVADGVLPWLAPADYVAQTIVPAVAEGAAREKRTPPPIIAETACVLSDDRDEVTAVVRQNMDFYLAMPAYRALFERVGLIGDGWDPSAGWSQEMVDAVVPWGDAERIAQAVEGYFAAGADEVVLSPVGAGPDPEASYDRTLEVLGELARG